MVEPFTVMMSSLPSLSQSIRPAPPLMDSTMYFFSGVEMWETVRPASWATSLNRGTGDCAAGACAGRDFGAAVWADAQSGSNRPRERMARMTRRVVIIAHGPRRDSCPREPPRARRYTKETLENKALVILRVLRG